MPTSEPDDPRATELEIGVAQERVRSLMFGAAATRHAVGRYLLLAPIGRGGMGTVFAAYDPQLDRRVAIKLMRPRARDPTRTEALRARMIAEARAMAKVAHPNVITIHETGALEDDTVWIAMELIDGPTLRRWLGQARRSWREIVAVYIAAGRGLAAVHDAGLVHRDFKGDNAMIDRHGHVRLMDFGLARDGETTMHGDSEASPSPGTRPAGTPGYMAPEQVEGGALDQRADQYALCVALYEALWARHPFQGSAHAPSDPPRGGVPGRIRRAILRGLSPDRDQRFASMAALLAELEPRRRRALALGLGAAAIASLAATTWVLRPTPCRVDDELVSTEIATRIQDAFVATGSSYAKDAADRAIAGLHDYETAWVDERHRSCVATRIDGTQSEARMDRRMRCLERRRQDLLAVAQQLAVADADTVDHATAVVAGLASPGECDDDRLLDADGSAPMDPEQASAVAQLDAELALARASLDLGHPREAAALAEDLLVQARDLEFPPLVARAELTHARALAQSGDLAEALPRLRSAFFSARAAPEPEAAALAAFELASIRSSGDGALDEARVWFDLAKVERTIHGLDRLEDDELEVAITIAQTAGAWDEAIALSQQRLAWLNAHCDDGCDELGNTHRDLANMLLDRVRAGEALVHTQDALAYELGRHEAGHPHVAEARVSLAEVLVDMNRIPEAIPELERALADLDARYGPDSVLNFSARAVLGRALTYSGRVSEGIAHLERAVRVASTDPHSMQLALLHHLLGSAYYWHGRLDDAAASLGRAIEIHDGLFPDGHPNTSLTLLELANVERERGHYEEALASSERALAMRRAHVKEPELGQAQMVGSMAITLEKMGRGTEAEPRYEEAVALTAEGDIESMGVTARVRLARLRFGKDREAALALVDEAARRCALLHPDAVENAACGLIDEWHTEHGTKPR
jgi:tetratricopeptide (TPR) repeat protein/tRNA A-37 threonylcarbamoyl transferase component Bud32